MAEGFFPLEVRGLGVTLGGHAAIVNAELAIDGSKRVVVLGANGAGKSVLLRLLHGLIAPTAGTILWAGATERPRAQAMVFQRPVMLRRGAAANVEYALHVNGVHGEEGRRRAAEAIERVGLAHLADSTTELTRTGTALLLGDLAGLAFALTDKPDLLFLACVEPSPIKLDKAGNATINREVERARRQLRNRAMKAAESASETAHAEWIVSKEGADPMRRRGERRAVLPAYVPSEAAAAE